MNPVAGLVVEAWNDVDRVTDGLAPEDAVANVDGQSSIAWTLGHVTEHLDRMINHSLLGRERHSLLGVDRFRMGSEGVADEWDAIRNATHEVRDGARSYLEGITEEELDRRYEPPGSITKQLGAVTVRYTLLRIASHHYFHVGVIACQRDLRGHSVGDYPGLLDSVNET
ncbi:MAG: DinB family protein [Actinomycetota bacterium]